MPILEEEHIQTDGAVLVGLRKALFQLDGLFERLKNFMAHWSDRGPEDYERDDQGLRDLISRAAREGARASVEIQGGYHEGGKGSSPSWRNWVMTLLGALIVIGVSSLVVMYGNMTAMKVRMDNFEHRMDNLERRVYRGAE